VRCRCDERRADDRQEHEDDPKPGGCHADAIAAEAAPELLDGSPRDGNGFLERHRSHGHEQRTSCPCDGETDDLSGPLWHPAM
jgi:hypothetical protein